MTTLNNNSCDRSSHVYEAYEPDLTVISKVAALLENKTILMVIGTWCSDSQTHVPAFYKILDEAGFAPEGLKVIEVNKAKEAIAGTIDGMGIISVPTIIIFEHDQEIGRIVEQPLATLESDLLNILLNK